MHTAEQVTVEAAKPMDANPGRKVNSLIYNLMVKTARRHGNRLEGRLWDFLKKQTKSWNMPVDTRIHGYPARVNFGYTYPATARIFHTYNNPLVELVHQKFVSTGKPVRLVDVGAAIGDTVLLVHANCPGEVSEFVCLDGDVEFFRYLQHNLGSFPNCRLIRQQLSRTLSEERSLVRTHRGTASAQGADYSATSPLDTVLASHNVGPVDVLKIDVDGFDGEVLMGAVKTLAEQRPAVIFEWHPILCQQTGNDFHAHFEALTKTGYQQLIWFTKFGDFSHFGSPDDRASIDRLADLCLRSRTLEDWHFDIIALHSESSLDALTVAELAFAKKRRSQF